MPLRALHELSQLTTARNTQEEPNFTLIDVPDHQLDEDGLKEKRKQKLMKAGFDARERAKAERDAEKERLVGLHKMQSVVPPFAELNAASVQEEERKRDEEARLADPEKWLADLRTQHEVSGALR